MVKVEGTIRTPQSQFGTTRVIFLTPQATEPTPATLNRPYQTSGLEEVYAAEWLVHLLAGRLPAAERLYSVSSTLILPKILFCNLYNTELRGHGSDVLRDRPHV